MTEQVLAVQRMQDYIASHLTEPVGITELAAAAGYSPWYARKLFQELLGVSPSEYIRKLRLKRSALMLREGNTKVIDAALETGFHSVDGFQRAFLREYGCNPLAYEKNPVPIPLFIPYGVKFTYLRRRTEKMAARNVFIQVIDKPKRKVIIRRGISAADYWSYCNEVGCDVWGILSSIKSISGEPVCLWLPEAYIASGTSEYVQGTEVEADYQGVIPDGFDVIELPAAKYLMFQGEPFAEEDYEIAINEIWEAEKKYDPSLIGYQWDDTNPRIQLEPIGSRGYIELRPIR